MIAVPRNDKTVHLEPRSLSAGVLLSQARRWGPPVYVRLWHFGDIDASRFNVRFCPAQHGPLMSQNDPKRTLPLALSSASEDRCGWPLSGVLNPC